jgi:hypothetical protein
MLFDKLSLLAGLWPVLLALFLLVYAAFVLMKEFVVWCLEPNEKEKARQELFDFIKNGGGNPEQFNRLAKKAGLKFGDDYFNEVKNLTIKSGDIILWGVRGVTKTQYEQQKESLKAVFPKGCIVFPVNSGEGLLAIITPDKSNIEKEPLLRQPTRKAPESPTLSY